jgi:RNA polymerase sigma-54 factor|tara:strand:+ start:40380 stop:41897 length:1518 start_codon:yes stop_codon:yes gene_type:complete
MAMRQQMTLFPRLQQSVKLLQMSTLAFHQEVSQALATNPFLEEDDDTADASEGYGSKKETRFVTVDSVSPEFSWHANESQTDEKQEPSIEHLADSPQNTTTRVPDTVTLPPETIDRTWSGDYPQPQTPGIFNLDVGDREDNTTSLNDMLRAELCWHELSPRDHALVEIIIEALDEDGYLRLPFNELFQHDETFAAPSIREWEFALQLVQQIAPPGIGARDLSECLLLQLNALPKETSFRHEAIDVVNNGLNSLAKHDFSGLARQLGHSKGNIVAALNLIRSLNPRPASAFTTVDPSFYVIPDVRVLKDGKKWVAILCEESMPKARLHARYARLFRDSQCSDRTPMSNALQEARWLLRNIEQRASTMQKVAQGIVARQQAFFKYGDAALQPLMLSEIADELGLHESTVSRATSNKYLVCPLGVYSFKHFFQRELATNTGGKCSSGAVRALIREMIDAENPSRPLSDVVLTEKLADQGVIVARRTVSKYRAQINIPPVELRREPVSL